MKPQLFRDYYNNIIIIIIIIMEQQPLKSFDCPLMRVSLSNSILVTLIFY